MIWLTFSSWDDYFEENQTQTEQIQIFGSYSSRRSYIEGRVYVINSVFDSLVEQNEGGGIYFNSSDAASKLLIEDTQFFNCSTYKSGGGLYKGNEGSSVLSRVCGFECTQVSLRIHEM